MTTRYIKDKILKLLSNDIYFKGMVTANEVNENTFSAIDIVLAETKNKTHVFRIMVIKRDWLYRKLFFNFYINLFFLSVWWVS